MHRLALILVLTSACAADSGDEGFNIVNNIAPTATCVVEPGGATLGRGLIDKASPGPYVITPEFVSRISAAEGTEFQRTIALRGANIEVKNAMTGASLGEFKSLFTASLSPGGKATAAFDIVTPAMLQASGAVGTTRVQLVARITAFGALGGSGDTIDGVPFEYPVTVCDGCIANILGACPLPFETVIPPSTTNGCNAFQDGMTQCCMGADGPICPPTQLSGPRALTVTKGGAGAAAATITSAPGGISCGTVCTAMFPDKSTVTLTSTSAATTWTAPACTTAGTTCTVTMDQAVTVTATIP